jgi:serine protease Do
MNDLSSYISSKAPGTTVKLELMRSGVARTVSIALGTFPDETEQASQEEGRKGKLGMTLRNLSPDVAERLELPRSAKGVVVTDVEAGEAAEKAGLQQGDVIVSVNGTTVADVDGFEAEIARARSDGLARLRVRRRIEGGSP